MLPKYSWQTVAPNCMRNGARTSVTRVITLANATSCYRQRGRCSTTPIVGNVNVENFWYTVPGRENISLLVRLQIRHLTTQGDKKLETLICFFVIFCAICNNRDDTKFKIGTSLQKTSEIYPGFGFYIIWVRFNANYKLNIFR